MSIFDEVLKHIDGNTLGQIAQQLGATPQQTQSAIQVALPAIVGGMQRNIANGGAQALHTAVQTTHQGVDIDGMLGGLLGSGAQGGGAGGLLGSVMGMIGGGGNAAPQSGGGMGGLLGSVMGMMGGGGQQQSSPLSAGMGILGHVLGGSQQRATQGVAQSSGLSTQSSAALMAMLAPMVMAALGKMMAGGQAKDAQGLAGIVTGDMSRLGHPAPAAAQEKGFMGGLLDADGDGDVDASDLLNRGSMLMGLFGKR
jgi:hypothetical protein